MTHKIEIPEGCKATFSNENGCLVIEVEPKVEPVSFKAGDVLVIERENYGLLFISKTIKSDTHTWIYYGCAVTKHGVFIKDYCVKYTENTSIRHATPEERKQLFDRIEKEGYKYNPETHKVEKLKWKPKEGDIYYTPFTSTGSSKWFEDDADTYRLEMNAVFKTKEESDEAAEKIKQIFAK